MQIDTQTKTIFITIIILIFFSENGYPIFSKNKKTKQTKQNKTKTKQNQKQKQKQKQMKTQTNLQKNRYQVYCNLRSILYSVCDIFIINSSGGGTDPERGYGDVRPWRPPFHASPAGRKGPISSKRVSLQDPLLRKFGNFSLNSLNFHPNFSSQAPKFGNFQLTSPQIWKFSAHKPPFSWQMSVRKPHILEIRAAHPCLKISWVPPPNSFITSRKMFFYVASPHIGVTV